MKKLLFAMTALMSSAVATAQSLNVTGSVVDETGEALAGATVLVQGTTKGTTTDINGKFTLKDVDKNDKLTISFIGMMSQTLTPKASMRITLENNERELDDVMVVAFGKQTRASFTGSATIVNEKKIEQKQLTNVLGGLQGEAAGVQMINTQARPLPPLPFAYAASVR